MSIREGKRKNFGPDQQMNNFIWSPREVNEENEARKNVVANKIDLPSHFFRFVFLLIWSKSVH